MPAARREKSNRRLASFGAMLEYYDFVAYIYVASAIGAAFFPAGGSETLRLVQTFGIYATGFIVRPLAGIVMASVADRIGRKRVFLFTLVLMSVATLGIGLLPTYSTVGWLAPVLLLLMRVLQGCAVGGELPAAAVYVSEFAGPSRVGYSGAYLMSMAYGGFLLGAAAALVAELVATHVLPETPSLQWRLPFIIGGFLGLVFIYLRRRLEETPAFRDLDEAVATTGGQTDHRGSVRTIIRDHRSAVLIGFLMVATLTAMNIVFFQYWPTYLQVNLGYSADRALVMGLLLIVAAMLAMPVWGRFADRFGWSRLYFVGGTLTAGTSLAVFLVLPNLNDDSWLAYVLPIPAAISAASMVAAVPGLLASMFPTAVRQSGYAIPYNVGGAIFAGSLPLMLPAIIAEFGQRTPLAVIILGCILGGATSAAVGRVPKYLGAHAEDDELSGGSTPAHAGAGTSR